MAEETSADHQQTEGVQGAQVDLILVAEIPGLIRHFYHLINENHFLFHNCFSYYLFKRVLIHNLTCLYVSVMI